MTPEQLHIVQHSLGADQYGRGTRYRNHFVSATGPGSNEPDCMALVALGFMKESGRPSFLGAGDRCFVVTEAGIAAMERESPRPPKRTRGHDRYETFRRAREVDPDLSFGDWLRRQKERRP